MIHASGEFEDSQHRPAREMASEVPEMLLSSLWSCNLSTGRS